MKNKLVSLLIISFILFFAVFIVKTTNELSRSRERILESENVIDVTNLISTKFLISSNDSLEKDWTHKSFDDSEWAQSKIPSNDLVKQKEYSIGKYAYYRIKVPTQAFSVLPNLKNETSLALQYVMFSHVDIFVNGTFIKSTTPKSMSEYLQIVPVPFGEESIIAIKGHILDPIDTGIDHRVEIVLGKTSELNQVFVAGFKRQTTFHLVFLLCKGSILFIFALIFLLLKVDTSFSHFFYFGLCTMVEELISGEYLNSFFSFKTQVYLYNSANIGATVFVILFFTSLLNLKIKKRNFLLGLIGLAVTSTLIATDVITHNYYFDIPGWMKFWNVITVLIMLCFVPKVYKFDKKLLMVLLIIMSLYLWSVSPSNNIGVNFKRYGNLLLFVMVAYQTFVIFRREQILLQSKERQILEQEKDVAIGKTASLLAHDVRKPLDQMKLVLDKLASGEVNKEFIEMAKDDINFSIESVTRQVNEIMNYGKAAEINLKEISFYRVLSHSIKQIMSVHQEMDIVLEYDFETDNKIIGEETRLSPVLVNLISNAVEAIRDIGNRYKGKIRFSSRTVEDKFLFSIFNDGPEIPPSVLNEIFKPLFTHGKASGTGLGLSSVLKAINDMKGKISVRNIPGEGVEFKLIFQVSKDDDSYPRDNFLSNSKAYEYKTERVNDLKKSEYRIFALESDEEAVNKLVQQVPFKAVVSYFSETSSAKEALNRMRYDLYLLNEKLGGLELAKNELSFLDNELLVYSRIDSILDFKTKCEQVYTNRAKILLVDDTKLFQAAWIMYHGQHNIECASSPEEALQLLAKSNKRFDAYVLDFHFSNSSLDGEALAKKILDIHGNARIFISSSVEQSVGEFGNLSKREYEVRKYLV